MSEHTNWQPYVAISDIIDGVATGHLRCATGMQQAYAILTADRAVKAKLLAACKRVVRAIEWATADDQLTHGEQAAILRDAIAKAGEKDGGECP